MKDDLTEERMVLYNYDVGGTEDTDQGQFTFVTTSINHYNSRHGRTKYRFDVCSVNWEVPDNCGFAADNWHFPEMFRPCSKGCRGALAIASTIIIVVDIILCFYSKFWRT